MGIVFSSIRHAIPVIPTAVLFPSLVTSEHTGYAHRELISVCSHFVLAYPFCYIVFLAARRISKRQEAQSLRYPYRRGFTQTPYNARSLGKWPFSLSSAINPRWLTSSHSGCKTHNPGGIPRMSRSGRQPMSLSESLLRNALRRSKLR
jgi:hypothetical protein